MEPLSLPKHSYSKENNNLTTRTEDHEITGRTMDSKNAEPTDRSLPATKRVNQVSFITALDPETYRAETPQEPDEKTEPETELTEAEVIAKTYEIQDSIMSTNRQLRE